MIDGLSVYSKLMSQDVKMITIEMAARIFSLCSPLTDCSMDISVFLALLLPHFLTGQAIGKIMISDSMMQFESP